jgi:hypothetical protein
MVRGRYRSNRNAPRTILDPSPVLDDDGPSSQRIILRMRRIMIGGVAGFAGYAVVAAVEAVIGPILGHTVSRTGFFFVALAVYGAADRVGLIPGPYEPTMRDILRDTSDDKPRLAHPQIRATCFGSRYVPPLPFAGDHREGSVEPAHGGLAERPTGRPDAL